MWKLRRLSKCGIILSKNCTYLDIFPFCMDTIRNDKANAKSKHAVDKTGGIIKWIDQHFWSSVKFQRKFQLWNDRKTFTFTPSDYCVSTEGIRRGISGFMQEEIRLELSFVSFMRIYMLVSVCILRIYAVAMSLIPLCVATVWRPCLCYAYQFILPVFICATHMFRFIFQLLVERRINYTTWEWSC